MIRLLIVLLLFHYNNGPACFLPVNSADRKSISGLSLSEIGQFGLLRKARPGIPAHYHTGIDIRRPGKNYNDEPVYPVCEGRVISIRRDGPYAQIIIEHQADVKFWTSYEHVAGIRVRLNESVRPSTPVARFMNREELDRYGWQFDHFHLEILKICPSVIRPDRSNPERRFSSYTLVCFTKKDLDKYFYNPVEFLSDRLSN